MRTAVAAPDAFEDLFEFIDAMTVLDLHRFHLRLRLYLIAKIAGEAEL